MGQETTTTTLLEVYDPAMCCSTGVCGPVVDDKLVTFAQDVKWLESQGVTVNRYNLGQEPEKFRDNTAVLQRLQEGGMEILPLLTVNGEIVSDGGYPDREQLMQFTGIGDMQMADSAAANNDVTAETTETADRTDASNAVDEDPFIYSEKVDILVAIGSSVAAGCESCLKSHFVRGKKAGLSKDDMAKAMQSGLNVRQVPMSQIIGLANKLLGNPAPANGCTPGGGCC
ncbi:MAG: arsenite efflux transporter metallochaperone ArsD [Balneolales bacterium]